ncbi:MAG: hypothetical protein K2Q25_12840 [Mycobacteriaceae bacterium]|nr:hypothetical protein [Mycobacteriaceae bacterium]
MADPGLGNGPSSWNARITQVLALIEGLSELAEVLKGAVLWGLEGPPPQAPTEDEAIDVFHVIGEIILFLMGIELEDHLIARIPDNGTGVHGYTKNGVEICFIIVLFIMILFTILGYLNGWGPPDEGEKFDQGQSQFDRIYEIIEKAKADPDQWSSGGAVKYNAKNQVLSGAVRDVENADKEIVGILQHQAGQVAKARIELESTMGSLEALLAVIAGVAGYTFRANPASFGAAEGSPPLIQAEGGVSPWSASPEALLLEKWLLHIVLGASIVAVAVAISFVSMLIDEGRCNSSRLNKRKKKYEDAHDDVVKIAQGLAVGAQGIATTSAASTSGLWSIPARSDASTTLFEATTLTGSRADKPASIHARAGDGFDSGNGVVDTPPRAPAISQEPQTPVVQPAATELGQPCENPATLLTSLLTRVNLSGSMSERISLLASLTRISSPVAAEPAPGAAAAATGMEYGPAVPVEAGLVGAAPAAKPIGAQRNV